MADSIIAQADIDEPQFNRDIRPILSDRCFLCHGPDQSSEQSQESDLRLDQRESALQHNIFDFEDVDESEILFRINSDDPYERMPPKDSHKKSLNAQEVRLIRRWIEQGAKYQQHWAYLRPKRSDIPKLEVLQSGHNPIDEFVRRKLELENLRPAESADRNTLIRRVSFDLIGLPPTVDEIDLFVNDPAERSIAFEKAVDRLLQRPQYGEHMARVWMDAARYADTSGYQYDFEREQWVWRDWVIHAFNSNKPFDEFTIEQIAGDLLPNADDQTRLATGFNRNHPITIEGGVVDEEYRTEYVIDRVVTTSTVWMGQTLLCARCHDHKFDPISQKEFYQFYSFFNNVPEKGLNGFEPKISVASPLASEQIAKAKAAVKLAKQRLDKLPIPFDKWEAKLRKELPDWTITPPKKIESSGDATHQTLVDQSILFSGKNPDKDDYEFVFLASDNSVSSIRLETLTDDSLTSGSASRGSNGNFVLTEFVVEVATNDQPGEFTVAKIGRASATYEQSGFTINQAIDGKLGQKGWAVDGNTNPANQTAYFHLVEPIQQGSIMRIRMQHRYGLSHQIGRLRFSFSESADADVEIAGALQLEPSQRDEQQTESLKRTFIEKYADVNTKQRFSEWRSKLKDLEGHNNFPATMVMREMPTPRKAYVLDRGEYDKPLKNNPLESNVPEAMGAINKPADGNSGNNRLDLAKWLVSRDQPLTARVTVNRFWQQMFGVGLVKTSEDFGSQGEYPSHPELLDWLAVEFVESGWDVKHLLKTVVSSETYQQSSVLNGENLERDPENRLLARGPRNRLDAESIRDNALSVSGLLSSKLGGPSVYPYHPKGLWLEINNRPNFSREYPHQTELDQFYRRSMYTFGKRTASAPSMATFDAPSREYCVVRRSRTNTPLQAFVLLNDPQFVEAAKHLAARMVNEGGVSTSDRIGFGFKLCTSREPTHEELMVLNRIYEEQSLRFEHDETARDALLAVGVAPVDDSIDQNELAALAQVARILMNLSEFLTKG